MSKRFIEKIDILQLIAGDESVFTLVYELYSEKVYRLAFRFLKDKEQCEEVVQETFINLWLSREKLDPQGNIWLYLFVIAKRLSLNALRQSCKLTDTIEELLLQSMDGHNSTEEEIMAHDLEQFTEKIIQKLPRQQQLVFKMSRVEGLSYKEIADQLHVSPNTVKNHMVEALKNIKAGLKYSDFIYLILVYFCI